MGLNEMHYNIFVNNARVLSYAPRIDFALTIPRDQTIIFAAFEKFHRKPKCN